MVQLKAIADKTNKKANDLVGLVTVKIAQRIDMRSAVGDPIKWKNPPPKGYVGGRFRGEWQLGIDAIPTGLTGRVDPEGTSTLEGIVSAIPQQAAGHIYYLTNNLPYAQLIEDGSGPNNWVLHAAPAGVVSLTAMEFQQAVDDAAAQVQS